VPRAGGGRRLRWWQRHGVGARRQRGHSSKAEWRRKNVWKLWAGSGSRRGHKFGQELCVQCNLN
jgi:hypothetical protein